MNTKCSKCGKNKNIGDFPIVKNKHLKVCKSCRSYRFNPNPNPVRRGRIKLSSHEIVREWNYKKNEKDPSAFSFGSKKKVWWICKKNHEWEAVIKNRTGRKSGCPYCDGRRVGYGHSLREKADPKLLAEWNHNKNNINPSDVTPFSQKKVWWSCKEGHDFLSRICHRMNGSQCPYCAKRKVGYDNSLQDNDKQGILKEWNHKRNDKQPREYLPFSSERVWWICEFGHEWIAMISNRSNGAGCPYCTNKMVGYGNSLDDNDRRNLLKEWNYEKNKKGPECFTPCSSKEVWWICKKKHEWKTSIHYRASSGSGCPICKGSKGEKWVSLFLWNNNIQFQREKCFKSLGKLRFDFYVPKSKLLIEYDGQQHFDPETYLNKEKIFGRRQCLDLKKVQFASTNGFSMLRISSCVFDLLPEVFDSMLKEFTKDKVHFACYFQKSNHKANSIYSKHKAIFEEHLNPGAIFEE